MKIVCPTCEANYEVPESVLAAKRQVRCARCGNDWVPGANWQPETDAAAGVVPETTAPETATPASPVPAAEPPPQPPPQPPEPAAAPTVPEPPAPPPADPRRSFARVEDAPAPIAPAPAPANLPPAAARLTQSAASAFGDAVEPARAAPAPAPRAPVVAWIVSLVVLVALAGASVVFRTPIIKAWPPSERVYDAVGLGSSAK